MKRSLRLLIKNVDWKKFNKEAVKVDFEKLSSRLKEHGVHLSSHSIRRLWVYLDGEKRPKKKTLDRLALFAGFQNWDDLLMSLHGDSDE
jgi:hypothetical protein